MILLTVGTFILKSFSRSYPHAVEQWYTNGLYDGIRFVFDLATGWLPFPLIYLLIGALFILLAYRSFSWIRYPSFEKRVWSLISGILKTVSMLYVTFTWLWGFNYEKPTFYEKHKLLPVELSDSILFDDLTTMADLLDEVRIAAGLPDSIRYEDFPNDLDDLCRVALNEGLMDMGYEVKGHLRAKKVYPRGVLLRTGTAGIFLPFSGEGHVDAGLHPLQKPFVMTHEMSHAQGFTDEGVCNFVAYYALSRSSHPLLKYTGLLGYFRYLASQCRRLNSEQYATVFEHYSDRLKDDLLHISANSRKYPDIFPKLRNFTYDQYLKSQGVTAGLQSYNQMVNLHYQWQSRYGHIYE